MSLTHVEVKDIVDQALVEHEERERSNFDRALEEFCAELVPGGDPKPHRDFHQAKIDAAKAEKEAEESRKRFYDAMFSKLVEKGIDGFFGILRALVVLGFVWMGLKFGYRIPDWIVAVLK